MQPAVPAAAPRSPRPPEPVIGYVTVSHGSSDADHDRSAAVIAATCEATGRKLIEIVCDSAWGRPLDRPGLMHALGRIADGEAGGLVADELRALSRSTRDVATLVAWFRDAGATLVALDLGLDTATAAGREAAGALIALSDPEPQRNGRTAEGDRAGARTNGRPAVSDRPELRERIAAMRTVDMTLQEIADQLNAEQVPTLRGGARWRPSSIRSALGDKRPEPPDRMPAAKANGG